MNPAILFIFIGIFGQQICAFGRGAESVSVAQFKENGKNTTIELQLDELKTILEADDIKDRKVVVVSIAGSYRKGKSFLLNFFLKYLYAQYEDKNATDWMSSSNGKVFDGFIWRGGIDPQTKGIYMWSKVFTYDRDDEKLAIIVIDTQGIFDSKTTERQSKEIFALSTMLSSVQLYNVEGNIKTPDLENLQFFTEYGKWVAGLNEPKPYQKLIFVLRDWHYSKDNTFGYKPGNSHLHEMLDAKHELGNNIKQSFDKIEGFAMPHPGLEVTKYRFDGSLNEIDSDFIDWVRQFTESIFAPAKLIVKKRNGIDFKASYLVQYFDECVTNLNKNGFDSKGKFEMEASSFNGIAVRNAFDQYAEGIRCVLEGEPLPDGNQLYTEHQKLAKAAMDKFQASKHGREEHFKEFEKQLTRDIDAKYRMILKEHAVMMKNIELPPNGKDYGVQTAGFPMIVAIGLLILCGIGAGFYRYKAAQKHKKMRKVRKATNVHYRAKPKDTHRDCV